MFDKIQLEERDVKAKPHYGSLYLFCKYEGLFYLFYDSIGLN